MPEFRKIRIKTIEFLGGKCVNCGCDDFEALELNHKNGGGAKEQRESGSRTKQLYLDILSGRRKKEEFDLRCRVCNSLHYLTELKGIKDKWKITYIK
jgi:hypothetical protein